MSLKKEWKSTGTEQPPNGDMELGTFRDVSLQGLPPDVIDEIDSACIKRSVSRSSLFSDLEIEVPVEGWDEIFSAGRIMYALRSPPRPRLNLPSVPLGERDKPGEEDFQTVFEPDEATRAAVAHLLPSHEEKTDGIHFLVIDLNEPKDP